MLSRQGSGESLRRCEFALLLGLACGSASNLVLGPQGTSMAGIMLVGLGLKSGGLFTAEITTASTLKIMSTRKAKLHMTTS